MNHNRKSAAKLLSSQEYEEGSETIPRKGSTKVKTLLEIVDRNTYTFFDIKNIDSLKGIYAIYCSITNKFYVGSAINIKARMQRHSYYLRTNTHHSEKLQRAVHKYGIENFFIQILEVVETDDLCTKEIEWIAKLDACNDGFNMIDTCRKIGSFSLTAAQIEKRASQSSKSVMMFNLEGSFIKEFKSVTAAAKYVETSSSNISRVCNGSLNFMKDMVFVYKKDFDSSKSYAYIKPPKVFTETHKQNLSAKLKGKTQSKEHRDNLRISQGKWVDKYSETDEFIQRYYSISQCCQANNLDPRYLHKLTVHQTPFNGFKYKFSKDIVQS